MVSKGAEELGTWEEIPRDKYQPIAQGITILIEGEKKLEQSRLFFDFLFSAEAKNILNKFGYSTELNE